MSSIRGLKRKLSRTVRSRNILLWVAVMSGVVVVMFLPSSRSNSQQSLAQFAINAGLSAPEPPIFPLLEKMSAHKFTIPYLQSDVKLPDKIAACPNVPTERPSENIEEKFQWQPMTRDSKSTLVFSAYFDQRWDPVPAVMVVGLSAEYRMQESSQKYCALWYRGVESSHVVPASCRYTYETHSLRYAPSFYTCLVRDNDVMPYAVSIITDPCDTSSYNLLKVMTPADYDVKPVNYTVCVTPLNFNYDNVGQLVEMIEVNRMFGAQHFIFYNYSSGSNVTRYLKDFYQNSLNVVTVVPWSLPMPVNVWPPDPSVKPEVHYFGQVAALNDCLYRSINRRSTFVVFSDLDEIIVPRRRDSWSAMLDDVTTTWRSINGGKKFPGSYILRSSFFRTDWTQDQTFVDRGKDYQQLTTLTTTEREEKVFEWLTRSKYIVWAKAVTMVGVHSVTETVPSVDMVRVEAGDALVHHYRLWIDDPENLPARVFDRHMHQYADAIAKRTADVHRSLRNGFI